MIVRKIDRSKEILEYQPDAVEIEETPVPGKVRWVLYVILATLIFVAASAIYFKVDRIVVGEGKLMTTAPTIIVQSINTAIIRTIDIKVGDLVEKDQLLATLDPTFTSADLSQLKIRDLSLGSQIRRITSELEGKSFKSKLEEGENGRLQEQIFRQRSIILEENKRVHEDKIAALEAKLRLNSVQSEGKSQQMKLFRDVEGVTARLPQREENYKIKLLEAQQSRVQVSNDVENLKAEREVILNEVKQAESEWSKYLEERSGELMEQEVQLRSEHEKVLEEINKAQRLHDLVVLRAPEAGVVQSIVERSVGSVIRQAEPFITLIPVNSKIEAEVYVLSRDIARIRISDSVRIKLDAFPFQRHDTLPGAVSVISEDSFHISNEAEMLPDRLKNEQENAVYRTRISLLSTQLRDVPEGFRLQPGMKVRAEIKVGTRRVITYFLYPVIRAFDESLREP